MSGTAGTSTTRIVLDDTGVQQKLNAFNQGLTRTQTTIKATSATTQGLTQGFTKTTTEAGKASTAYGVLTGNMQKVNQQQQQLGKGLTQNTTVTSKLGGTVDTTSTKMQKFGNFAKNNLTNIGLLSGGIAGLDDQYLQLHKAQVANERANLMVSKSEQQVAKTTEALSKMRAEGKEGTVDYALKLKDLELANEKLDISQQRATVTQENLSEANEDFWTGIIPNALFVGGSAASMIKDLGVNSNTLRGIVPKLGAAFTALTGTMDTASAAAKGLSFSLGVVGTSLLAAFTLLDIIPKIQAAFDRMERKARSGGIETLEDEKARLEALLEPPSITSPSSWGAALARMGFSKEDLDFFRQRLAAVNQQIKQQKDILAGTTPKIDAMGNSVKTASGAVGDLFRNIAEGKDKMAGTTFFDPAEITTQVNQLQQLHNILVAPTGETLLEKYEQGLKATAGPSRDFQTGTSNTSKSILGLVDATGQLENPMDVINQVLKTGTTNETLYGKQIDDTKKKEEERKQAEIELHQRLIEHNKAVDDLANKYQIRLSPALIASQQQVQDLGEALANYNTAIENLKDPTDLLGKKPFDFKFDVDKKFEKFINGLGGDLETTVKLTFEGLGRDQKIVDMLTKVAKVTLNIPVEMEPDEKSADKFAQKTIDMIKEAYKKKGKDARPSPEIQKVIDTIMEIKKAPDSWTKLTQYFNSPEFLATLNLIDPLDAEKIGAALAPTGQTTIPISPRFEILKKQFQQSAFTNTIGDVSDDLVKQVLGDQTSLTIPSTVEKPDTKDFDSAINTSFTTASNTAKTEFAKIPPQFDKAVTKVDSAANSFFNDQFTQDTDNMVTTLQTAGKKMTSNWDKTVSKISDAAGALASQWSTDMNSFIDNAKAAAKGVNKALGSIKDVDVNVNIHVNVIGGGGSVSKKKIIQRIAEGGIVRAAEGLTTSSNTILMIGDNIGGKETFAAIPHNQPARDKTMALLNEEFGKHGNGDMIVEIHNHREQGIEEIRRLKAKMGIGRTKFGFG